MNCSKFLDVFLFYVKKMFYSQRDVELLIFLPGLAFEWDWCQVKLDGVTYQIKKSGCIYLDTLSFVPEILFIWDSKHQVFHSQRICYWILDLVCCLNFFWIFKPSTESKKPASVRKVFEFFSASLPTLVDFWETQLLR